MKKLMIAVSVLLTLCLLGGTTVFADVIPLIEPQGGEIALSDLAYADTPDDGYVVTDDGEPVLTVGYVEAAGLTAALSDVSANGYYTADFTLPDGVTQVFLTGLTRYNVSEIEQAIAAGYRDGSFTLTDLGFIDAEKTLDEDADDQLCWAASSADVLTYTGWAAQAGFTSADDLFELYIDSFENKGGHAYYGIGWFFNGVKNNNSTSAMPVNYPDSGNYLPQYAFDDYAEVVDLIDAGAAGVGTLYERLRDGCGVSLNAEIYLNGEQQGGHAVTCWGFVTDRRYAETNKNYYKSVIITDSDSDERLGVDRRTAPDVMSCCTLVPMEQDGGIDTYYFYITRDQVAVLNDSVTLRPYTDGLTAETSSAATMDRRTSPDLTVHLFYLSDVESTQETAQKFAYGSTIYYQPYFLNAGSVDYDGDFTVKIKVVDKNSGSTVYTRSLPGGTVNIVPYQYLGFQALSIPRRLAVGDYTITASINDDHATPEAYFYNNAGSLDFKVRETYRIRDVDGDDSVESTDVTLIMRHAAAMSIGLDELSMQRGDVNADGGLDILDATLTQRYLANIPIRFDIDTTGIYD